MVKVIQMFQILAAISLWARAVVSHVLTPWRSMKHVPMTRQHIANGPVRRIDRDFECQSKAP